jgi:hypothetical protein
MVRAGAVWSGGGTLAVALVCLPCLVVKIEKGNTQETC